jgi:RNA polymerase sigma-70 factor, ECF subfamily
MARPSDLRSDDSVLLSRALRGDEEALNELFSRYYRFLYFLACRVLGGREEAEDAVQNCLLRAVCNLQQFNNDGAFRSWLSRILVNEAISLLRKKRGKTRFSVGRVSRDDNRDVFEMLPGPELNPEQVLAKKESILALTKEVARLSAPLRSVVILCDIREYSMEEAGAMLCVTSDTVRSRLFRARRQLEAAMRSAQSQCTHC